jgi:hypothetical protein
MQESYSACGDPLPKNYLQNQLIKYLQRNQDDNRSLKPALVKILTNL